MAVNNIDNLDLGTFLQKYFDKGIYSQLAEDFRDWEMVEQKKVDIPPARDYNFQLLLDLAPAGNQFRDPGASNRAFARGFKVDHKEFTAIFKELQTTIEIDGQLLARAEKAGAYAYAEVWATQAAKSLISTKQTLATSLYQDGTGAIGHVGSAALVPGNDTRMTVALKTDRSGGGSAAAGTVSHAGWFRKGDVVAFREQDATPSAVRYAGQPNEPDVGTNPDNNLFQVISVNRRQDEVTLQSLDADFSVNADTISVLPGADEVIYRYGQQVFPDLTDGSLDYGTASTVFPGLESLAAADGRKVHGLDMSGILAGSQIDAAGQSIDIKFIEDALNEAKINVGEGVYDWKKMCASYATRSALIESKEGDRRFTTVSDNARGSSKFVYMHADDELELVTSRYIPEDVMWMIPEDRSSKQKVLEYAGSGMEVVNNNKVGDYHLKVAGGEYVDVVQQFMRGFQLLVCKHPAAIASITGFTNS